MSGGFEYGGWAASYGDEVYGEAMAMQKEPADLLLGLTTAESSRIQKVLISRSTGAGTPHRHSSNTIWFTSCG